VARSLLALSLLITLFANTPEELFIPAARGMIDTVPWVRSYTLFGLLRDYLALARTIAVIVLLVVASGWRPRWTAIAHWWVTWSFTSAAVAPDGGDQICSVLTFLLIPNALTDPRRWHWEATPPMDTKARAVASRVGLSATLVCRIQVAIVYFHSAVGKFNVPEWVNGTAIYYWLYDPRIGFPMRQFDYVDVLVYPDFMAPLFTWGPILLELALAFALTMSADNPLRKPLFVLGVLFHLGNVVLFHLTSFFFTMLAALVLLTRPVQEPFGARRLEGLAKRLATRYRFLQTKLKERVRPAE
jgi:antimicrobial peptide system SdpB family protein